MDPDKILSRLDEQLATERARGIQIETEIRELQAEIRELRVRIEERTLAKGMKAAGMQPTGGLAAWWQSVRAALSP